MSLSRKIAAAVESLPAPAPCVVSAEEGPYRLSLDLTASGPVGLAFDRLDFAADGRAELSDAALRAWGGRLAARVTYLMEPLVVLEVDAQNGEAELRSKAPTVREGRRAYYVAHLGRGHTLRLSRVVYDEAERRRHSAPCQLTVEALARLTDDLIASLD